MVRIDHYRFSATDVLRTFASLGPWWQHLAGDLESDVLHNGARDLADALTSVLGRDPEPHPAEVQLSTLGEAVAQHFDGRATSDDAHRALGVVWEGLHLMMQTMRASGLVAVEGAGTVRQLNVSHGGVPKTPVETVEVDYGGIVGDIQGNRTHHGRPWQALCFWSSEVIAAFASAGHPVAPGSAGENVTLSGIDWSIVRPGIRARVGTVLVDLTAWAIPCRHNARWFADGDFRAMSHERGPVSRVYATVVEPGRIAIGDAFTLER